jgi:hypothetical protein
MKFVSRCLILMGAAASALAQTKPNPPAPTPTVHAVLVLDAALSSKTPAGKEFRLLLDKAITLPDGKVLPRETPFHGVVVQSAAHSKKLPNGTLVLKVDEARPKHDPPIPLVVTIEDVGEDFDEDTPAAGKKDDKKKPDDTAPATGAKGPTDTKAQPGATPKFKQTQKDGVVLALSPQGATFLVAPGAELYLDDPTALSVTISEPPAKNP